MSLPVELESYPLCHFFLSGYLANNCDPQNFEAEKIARILEQYETVFAAALKAISTSKETLRGRPEFNFDSASRNGLESGVAVLRVINCLHLKGFENFALLDAGKATGADLVCEKQGQKVCCEVKAITKQSRGRKGLFLENQLYEKFERAPAKLGSNSWRVRRIEAAI